MPEKWHPVVKSIYNALRNGLAHSFSTKVILKVSDKPIEFGISWSKEIHFEYDSRRATLFLNVQQLSKDLHRAFKQYESELRGDAELRDRYVVWRKRQRVYEVKNESEKEAWKALIR